MGKTGWMTSRPPSCSSRPSHPYAEGHQGSGSMMPLWLLVPSPSVHLCHDVFTWTLPSAP
ncbi:hypothetical protein E2C01_012065 [Portunus trituberculatus]|uniref:Uncharacterized protein n=1 Tax=Portunus trituberculatus TaxID=210409 RepID=A0A5B7DDI5_PORTR|nr:hypothetical protein [Portunus trituberculatus]